MKKPTRAQLVAKADRVFSLYIRLHYSDDNGVCTCYTCWHKMMWNDRECNCWHRISRTVYFLRRDENNARPQCFHKCNSKFSGNWEPILFTRYLEQDLWSEVVHEIETRYLDYKHNPTKYKVSTPELEEIIARYLQLAREEADKRWIKVRF